jgi:hypothetical protein
MDENTYRVWLEQCDENGLSLNKPFPSSMHNYMDLRKGAALPRIGEKLELILNVEPNGQNDGEIAFIVRDIRHTVFQTAVSKELGYENDDSSASESTCGDRINMYVQPLDKP